MKRPDGWKNPMLDYPVTKKFNRRQAFQIYEAGADAYEEALMKYRVKMPPDFTPILIVIPSEEIE